MPIPSLTELTSGQGSPELAFGSGYAGGVPPLNIDFSNTEKRINEIADQAAKQKQADKAAFEKTLTSKLQSIGKYDGVLPEDRQELQSLNNQVRSEIIKNSYLYAPGALSSDANKNKLAELEDKIAEYSAKVDKSKQDKKFEEQLNVTLRNRPEYNNEETEALLQEWRSKKVDERTPFMPVDSGYKELLALEKEFYSKPRDFIQKEEASENDPMSYYSATYGVFDPEAYRNIYKRARGQFHASTYRRSPELQAQWEQDGMGGYEGYVNSLADANMKGKGEADALLIQRVKKERNESKLEEGRNKRAELNRDAMMSRFWANEAQQNEQFREKMDNSANKDLDDVVAASNTILTDLNNANPIKTYDLKKVDGLSDFAGKNAKYTKAYLLDAGAISGYNMNKLYPGGQAQYGNDVYGNLFLITDKNNNEYYAPTKKVYVGKKGDELVEAVNRKKLEDAYVDDIQEFVIPDMNRLYKEDDIVEMLLPTEFANKLLVIKGEYNEYKKSKSSNRPSAPTGGSQSKWDKYKNKKQ